MTDFDHLQYVREFVDSLNLDQVQGIYKQWKSNNDFDIVKKFIELFLYRLYLMNISPFLDLPQFVFPQRRDKDLPATGFLVFNFCVLYCINFPKYQDIIPELGKFTAIYMLVDCYIDDPEVDKKEKFLACKHMKILLEDPSQRHNLTSIHPDLFKATEIYEDALKVCPLLKPTMIELYEAQLEALQVQLRDDLTENDYRRVCYRKGAACIMIILSYISTFNDINSDREYLFLRLSGVAGQLGDDCCDIKEDMERGINTIATYHYRKYGNIDRLIADAIREIIQIPDKYLLMKLTGFVTIIHSLFESREYFSPEMREVTENLSFLHRTFIGRLNVIIPATIQKHLLEILSGKKIELF